MSRALVIGVDEQWCGQDATLPITNPFPFWLYGGDLQYLINALSSRSVAFAWRRLRLAGGSAERTDPSGYWNYELGRVPAFDPPGTDRTPVDLSPAPPREALRFPALCALPPKRCRCSRHRARGRSSARTRARVNG